MDVAALRKETWNDLQLPLMTLSRGWMGIEGAPLQVVGEADVCLESRRKSIFALVSVVQGVRRNLLSRDQI